MSFEDLAPELIVKIFGHYIQSEGPRKFLRNASKVNRQWHRLSVASSLWNEVSLKSLDNNINHLLKLGERQLLSNTQVLNLSTKSIGTKAPELQPSNFIELTKYCHNVKRLDISGNKVSVMAMELMTKSWPGIYQLVMAQVTGINDSFDLKHLKLNSPPLSQDMLDPVFGVWGKRLKHLDLSYCRLWHGSELISKVVDCCSSLEEFHLLHAFCDTKFDSQFSLLVDKLQRGCPKLQVLKLSHCNFVFEDTKDLIGFRKMKKFMLLYCNLNSIDISLLLQNSTELEEIEIYSCDAALGNISQIPSEKIKVLKLRFFGEPPNFLEGAVKKWQNTLTDLAVLAFPEVDITSVLEVYLQDNKDPKIEVLILEACQVQLPFLKIFIRTCEKLRFLEFMSKGEDRRIFHKLHSRKMVERVLNW